MLSNLRSVNDIDTYSLQKASIVVAKQILHRKLCNISCCNKEIVNDLRQAGIDGSESYQKICDFIHLQN
jgi:hypothetical protein